MLQAVVISSILIFQVMYPGINLAKHPGVQQMGGKKAHKTIHTLKVTLSKFPLTKLLKNNKTLLENYLRYSTDHQMIKSTIFLYGSCLYNLRICPLYCKPNNQISLAVQTTCWLEAEPKAVVTPPTVLSKFKLCVHAQLSESLQSLSISYLGSFLCFKALMPPTNYF